MVRSYLSGDPSGRRQGGPGLIVAAVVIAALAMSSCGIVQATKAEMNTTNSISLAGFSQVSVKYSPPRPSAKQSMTLNVDSNPEYHDTGGSEPVADQYNRIASIVWATFPYRFDTLSVTISSNGTQTFTHDELTQEWGPRPSGHDQVSLAATVNTGYLDAYITGGVIIGLILAFLVMRIFRKRRRRRSKAPPSAGKFATGEHHHLHLNVPHLNRQSSGSSRGKGWHWS